MSHDEYIFEFGRFRLIPAEHLLLCDGKAIPITGKAFQALLILASHPGRLVEKSHLLVAVWGDTFVEEGNLAVTISMLRKVLGDDRSENKYIETVSKQGYRFLPEVTRKPALRSEPVELQAEREDRPMSAGADRTAFSSSHSETPSPNTSPMDFGSNPHKYAWFGGLALIIVLFAGVALSNHPRVIESRKPEKAIHSNTPRPPEPSHDSEAYQLYTEGRYYWNKRTSDGFRHSIECFQRALLKDPDYADAYVGLADSYTLLASYGVETAQEAYPNAKAAAQRALQLDDSSAEAHTSLGMVNLYYEWDWPQADAQFRRAIELKPSYSLAHTWDADYLAAMGRPQEALVQALRARDLDPLSLMANTELGRVYYWNREYGKAIESYRRVLELEPYFARAHTRLGMTLAAQTDYRGALREFREASRLSTSDRYIDGLTGYAEAMAGDTRSARRMLADLTNPTQKQYVPPFSVALVCIGLGDRTGAMEWLDKAFQDRSTYMVYAKVDPLLDSMRDDPRFISLMDKMGFQAP